MTEDVFFGVYLPALEIAMENDNVNTGYHVKGPDWYIDSESLRNDSDLFIESNFKKHKHLFDMVSVYFDAKSHNFGTVNGVPIEEFRLNLLQIIKFYKMKFLKTDTKP